MGANSARLKLNKPGEGMMGTFKSKPGENSAVALLKEFRQTKKEKGELEGTRSVRKKYNIKRKYIYPREKELLAKEANELANKSRGSKLSTKSLLGKA